MSIICEVYTNVHKVHFENSIIGKRKYLHEMKSLNQNKRHMNNSQATIRCVWKSSW